MKRKLDKELNMELMNINSMEDVVRHFLEKTLIILVNRYGVPYEAEEDYYHNEFGIAPQEGERINKVYDFCTDNESGCGFAKIDNTSLNTAKDWDDIEYTIILQLYTVIDANGQEHLRYDAYHNSDTTTNDELCDIIHCCSKSLALNEMSLLLQAFEKEKGKEQEYMFELENKEKENV